MSSVTNLTELNINYLTQDQYDTALANNEINENELYFTENNNIDVALDMVSLRPDTTLTLNTTFQKLPYKTVVSRISNGGIYVADGTFTCQKDGFIEISASYYYSGATTGTTLAYLYVYKNGSTIHGAAERAAYTSDYISLPAFVEEVKAGDVIEFMGKTASGTLLFAQGGLDISRATIKYLETVSIQKNTTYNFDIDMIYPVGSIYMSVNNVSPGTFLPGTTWEQIQDRFLLAAGSTYTAGGTGGSATTSLAETNLPSHNHSYTKPPSSTGGTSLSVANLPAHYHQMRYSPGSTAGEGYTWGGSKYSWTSATESSSGMKGGGGTGSAHSHTITGSSTTTGNTGSGTAFSNMPPYLTVYMWKRTA